jgi:LacI family transcriptional regulator
MASKRKEQARTLSRKDPNSDFLYQQIATQLRTAIDTGVHPPGSRLPSMDRLAAQFDVNKITVLKALDELKSEGVVFSMPAQGTFVTQTRKAEASRNGTFTVGLLSHVLNPHEFGPYHMGIIVGIQDELSRNKGNLLLLPAGEMQTDAGMYRLAMEAATDAMIYMGPFHTALLTRLIQTGRPAVTVDYACKGSPTDSILIDNVSGGYQAMAHLLELGHRRIAIITGAEDQTATPERLQGMMQALADAGVRQQEVVILNGDFTLKSGYEAGLQLPGKHKQCTAVCCMNDEMAAGVLQALYGKSTLRVPENISIIGFDDIHLAAATHPPLTSIRVDMRHMGRIAVQRLMDRMEDPASNPSTTLISTQLVLRGSTRALAKP